MPATDESAEYVKGLLQIIDGLRQEMRHTTLDAIERGREIDRLARIVRLAYEAADDPRVKIILQRGL